MLQGPTSRRRFQPGDSGNEEKEKNRRRAFGLTLGEEGRRQSHLAGKGDPGVARAPRKEGVIIR